MQPQFLSRSPQAFASWVAALAREVEGCVLEPGQSLDMAESKEDEVGGLIDEVYAKGHYGVSTQGS